MGKACCGREERPAQGPVGVFSPGVELAMSLGSGALLGIGVGVGRAGWEGAGRALAWASLAIGLVYGGRAAWGALRKRAFDIDVLMVLAAGLAAGMGHP